MRFYRLRGLVLVAAALLVPSLGFSQTTYGIWISAAEVANIPMSGSAWDQLKTAADTAPGVPNLTDQYETNNVYVLAKALVYARTGIESYRTQVIDQSMLAIDSEINGVVPSGSNPALALNRKLAAYVLAADL